MSARHHVKKHERDWSTFSVLNSTFGFYLQVDMSFKTVVYFVLTATYLIFQV